MKDNRHCFKASLHWSALENTAPKSFKNHKVIPLDKPVLEVSAAKAFKGDPFLYNPEDLLLSSLTSCHMMSFLYCCQKLDYKVLQYWDNSTATLKLQSDGSGKIEQVDLYPQVVFESPLSTWQIMDLHQKAHKLCFIANSCNFPIYIHPIEGI